MYYKLLKRSKKNPWVRYSTVQKNGQKIKWEGSKIFVEPMSRV